MTLRTQILIKNNRKTIQKTLESLTPLEGEVIVGNLGSTDGTDEVCRKFGAKVVDVAWKGDYSHARNQLLGEDWNLYLQPWESLAYGYDEIRQAKSRGVFYLQVYQGSTISKEIRYWNDSEMRFRNPVYETLDSKNAVELPVGILSNPPDMRQENYQLARKWTEDKGASTEPHYYLACALLSLGRYDEFFNKAEQYLIRESTGKAAIMLRHYLSQVQLHVFKDTYSAARNAMACIVSHPTMAEFWCVLGDILYRQKQYDKARAVYENAIVLGSRRSNHDHWPIDVPKYQEYPQHMIQNIGDIKKKARLITVSA